MTNSQKLGMLVSLSALMAAATIALDGFSVRRATESHASSCPENTICDEPSAIDTSLQLLPPGVSPTASVARLITLEQALEWQGLPIVAPTDPGLQVPVWVVGLRAPGLKVSDHGFPTEDDHPIDGMWFVWVASGGGLDSRGGLAFPGSTGPGARTFAGIESLSNQNLPIDTPTPYPTAEPGPWPTSELWP